MSLIRRHATALLLLVVASVSFAGMGFPNSDVQEALAILSEPSVPTSLEGDTEIADGRFVSEQNCAGVRARYQSAEAPIPTGSTIREDTFGNLQVEAPYGPAAVILADAPASSCEYQLASNPTMVIDAGVNDRIVSFSGVLCSALLGYPAVGGEYLDGGEPHAVLALMTDPERNEWQIAIGPGSLEANLSAEETGPDVILGSFSGTLEDGLLIGDGQSDTGPLHVEMRCTPFRKVLNTG
jgi:hypothetical protein